MIRQGKDRGLGKLGYECGERSLMCRGPLEGSILQGQVKERARNGRVICNKAAIEVAEVLRPMSYASDLDDLHKSQRRRF